MKMPCRISDGPQYDDEVIEPAEPDENDLWDSLPVEDRDDIMTSQESISAAMRERMNETLRCIPKSLKGCWDDETAWYRRQAD
jgi:hypothetical protein